MRTQVDQARLRREAGPLGSLERAVDAVCALGRGERLRKQHWTEKQPTDRQRAMAEAMGVPTYDRRWTRGDLADAIAQEEGRGATPVWSKVRPALMEAAFGSQMRREQPRRQPRVDWADEGAPVAPF